jgi:hypothetical protein
MWGDKQITCSRDSFQDMSCEKIKSAPHCANRTLIAMLAAIVFSVLACFALLCHTKCWRECGQRRPTPGRAAVEIATAPPLTLQVPQAVPKTIV